MIYANIFRKEITHFWGGNEVNWAEPPFLAPYALEELDLEYAIYAYWGIQDGQGELNVQLHSGSVSTIDQLSGKQVILSGSLDFEAEGFKAGHTLYIFSYWTFMTSTFIAVHTCDVLSVGSGSMLVYVTNYTGFPAAFTSRWTNVALFQPFVTPPAGILLRNGEEDTFISPLTGVPPTTPNANAAERLSFTANHSTYTLYLPRWGGQDRPYQIQSQRAVFRVGHFYPVRTQTDLQAITPQTALYPNKLFFRWGIDARRSAVIELRTTQLNLYENNTLVNETVGLSGTNGSWSVAASGAPVGTFVTLHNDTAAHQASVPSSTQLLQSAANPNFSLVPPQPRAIAVAVYQDPVRGYGVRVSNAISVLPMPSGDITIQAYATHLTPDPYGGDGGTPFAPQPARRPWDILVAESSIQLTGASIKNLRFWTLYKLNNNTEYLCEVLEFLVPPSLIPPYTQSFDITSLYEFFNLTRNDILLYDSLGSAKVIIRSYLPKYLFRNIAPTLALIPDSPFTQGVLEAHLLVELADGRVLYAKDAVYDLPKTEPSRQPIRNADFTTLGTWTRIGNVLRWTYGSTSTPFVGFEYRYFYRAAIFKDELSADPLSQSDNTTHVYTTSPLVGPRYDTGPYFTCDFPVPSEPGRYIFLMRIVAIEYDDTITNNYRSIDLDACEYYVLDIPPPLPLSPSGESACPPCVPALPSETIPLLFPEPPTHNDTPIPSTAAGDWYQANVSAPQCFDRYHCGLTRVSTITAPWIDLLLEFDNRVWGRSVQGTHLLRALGQLRRIDDEYSVERYITKNLTENDLIRTYRARYEVELLITAPCMLFAVELAKFARRVTVRTREGMIREVTDLVPEDISIADRQNVLRATIKLRAAEWRKEYRY